MDEIIKMMMPEEVIRIRTHTNGQVDKMIKKCLEAFPHREYSVKHTLNMSEVKRVK